MKKIILASAMLIAFTAASAANAEVTAEYTSNGGVEFIPNKGITPPVDPENPPEEVTPGPEVNPPGTNGPLSIDFASSLNFGVNLITSNDEKYNVRAQGLIKAEEAGNINAKPYEYRPNYVQVTDNRGTNSGWSLKVKQNGQFKNEKTLNTELTASAVTFTKATPNSKSDAKAPDVVSTFTLNPAGAETLVMSAQNKAGAGTWVDFFGEKDNLPKVQTIIEDAENEDEKVKIDEVVNPAITLTVPGSTPKDAVKYTTSFTWTLSDTPGTGESEQPNIPLP